MFDFHYPHIPFCNFQNSVSEKNAVLLNFCLCVYVQFDCMVYHQIVGIPIGTNCARLILYCYERDFMSNPQKSKWFDLIDKFNDTSRYLDDIFTIDDSEFTKHIPDLYSRQPQLNKTNTSDKAKSRKYRGIFEKYSPEKNSDKFGKNPK